MLSSGRLRGTSVRIAAVASRFSVSACSSPMSATTTSPAWKRPGATASPSLRPWNVTVTAARTAAVAISPVDASTPDGTSIGDDRSAGGVDPLDRGCRLLARLAVEAGPEQRVDDHVGLLDCRRLDGVAALLTQDPRRDPAVAAVRAAAADDGDPAGVGEALEHLARDGGAGALHQLRDVVALLRGARLVGGVERLKHRR